MCGLRVSRHARSRVLFLAFLVILLLLNVIVGCIVVYLTARINFREDQKPTVTSKSLLDEVYEEAKRKKIPDIHESAATSVQPLSTIDFLHLLKPVAHLSGLDFGESESYMETMQKVRHWAVSEGSERHLLYNDLQFEEGSIVVPVTGVYHVYSHVKFYVEDNKKNGHQHVFYHDMVRYNAESLSEEVILSTEVSECKEGINDGAHLEYPSDTRVVFQLQAGDSVAVRVSNITLLRHDREWHYFGMYLL